MELCQEKLDALVTRINELYITYRKRYVLCLPGGRLVTPKRKGELYSVLTNGVVCNHLQQKYAVAVFAGPSTSRFICFDVDEGTPETVRGVVDTLADLGFPRDQIYVSYSGGKGYHVELFFDQLVKTATLRALYERVIAQSGFTVHQVEFRPTHGSAIKLPLSKHARTGNICWFVDRDTLESIERIDYLFEIQQISAALLYSIIPYGTEAGALLTAEQSNPQTKQPAHSPTSQTERSDHTKPQTYDELVVQANGTRHNLMRKMAVSLRASGLSREECEQSMVQWYEQQDQSLICSSREEVLWDIHELLNWVFSERFRLHTEKRSENIRITATDMRLVMRAYSRSSRRILFLLLVRSIAGRNAIAISEIAATTDLSRKTVYKVIVKLKEQNLILCESGARIQIADGIYANERNRYKVPHFMGSKNEPCIELSIADIMGSFEVCYHRSIRQLLSDCEIMRFLPGEEYREHKAFCSTQEQGDNRRLDLSGQQQCYQSEVFGELEAYLIGERVLYPLLDVARLIGWKHPEQLSGHCPGKEKWEVRSARRVVTRYYIDQVQLKLLLQRCRSKNKKALLNWLCP